MSEGAFIGVVGASGDLGKQIAELLVSKNMPTLAYSRSLEKLASLDGVEKSTILADLTDCTIIHWCAPLKGLAELPTLSESTMLILHDSVMHNSLTAIKKLAGDATNVAIVHWLMNSDKRVVIASESYDVPATVKHFDDIGLNPLSMSVKEHDTIMAHSQAPLAILCKVLLPQLDEYDAKGLLTPSAKALKDVLESRTSNWTDATLHSILSNPELENLLAEAQSTIKKYL